jgi:hypothetical protein
MSWKEWSKGAGTFAPAAFIQTYSFGYRLVFPVTAVRQEFLTRDDWRV